MHVRMYHAYTTHMPHTCHAHATRMQTFEGTHRFHNFASGLRAANPGLWCAPVEGEEEATLGTAGATPGAAAGSRGGETKTTSAELGHMLQHPEKQAEMQAGMQAEMQAEKRAEEPTPKLLPRCLGCLQQVHEELRAIYTTATAAGEAAGEADLCWPLALDVLAASRNSAACRTVTRCRVGGRLVLGGTKGV